MSRRDFEKQVLEQRELERRANRERLAEAARRAFRDPVRRLPGDNRGSR